MNYWCAELDKTNSSNAQFLRGIGFVYHFTKILDLLDTVSLILEFSFIRLEFYVCRCIADTTKKKLLSFQTLFFRFITINH